ncbi:unnamed protein product [Fusarium equiseti]|uniref:Uncharacterized protein n=1 Tax=Fusarium equiseti TaxID=61235 RepID=A0A8J2NJW8_FUSEQ|nr:unnamed protein product [Fusarium equiseti]
MDSMPFHAEDRKPGVDYVQCQAEFDIQMLLLKEDIKNRFGWSHDQGEQRGMDNFSWSSHQSGIKQTSRQVRRRSR